MQQLPQQLINGIWQGAALALFAMGYTLVFGVLDVINLAHGATYMWGAYFSFALVTRAGLPLWTALPLAMFGSGLLAVGLDRLAFKPLRALTVGGLVLWGGFLLFLAGAISGLPQPWKSVGAGAGAIAMIAGIVLDYHSVHSLRTRRVPQLAPMISSIGASIILISLAQGVFGADVQRFPPGMIPTTPYAVTPNAVIAPIQVAVLLLALVLMAGLSLLVTRSKIGRAIRAIAYSERTSGLLGINVNLVVAQTFFLSGALAGAAGALLGLAFNRLDPFMGNDVELAGLTVIIVGGMGSIGGAAVAAFLVGMIRVLSVGYVDSSFRDAFVFSLLILVLLVRPNGLFGRTATRS